MTSAAEIIDNAADKTGQRGDVLAMTARVAMRDRLLDRAQLAQLPEPEPLITGTLDRRTMALLVGYWGTGKTFLSLDWAASIATGKPWQGRTVRQGPVLYVAAEGAYGLDRRLAAWEYAWRTTIDPATFTVHPEKIDLLDRAAVAELTALAATHSYALVILDTIARCIPGADENSAKDMGLVVDAMDQIKRALDGGTVLGVHHTGKDRTTTRGSSSLEAGLDTVYTTEGDERLLVLHRTKRKDGPREDRHQLQLHPVLQSCIVQKTSQNRVGTFARQSTVVSDLLRDVFGTNGASQAQLRDAAMEHGLSRTDAYRGIKALVTDGVVRVGGTDTRPYYWPLEEEPNP